MASHFTTFVLFFFLPFVNWISKPVLGFEPKGGDNHVFIYKSSQFIHTFPLKISTGFETIQFLFV